jgi:2,4-dienoyl-CoA reductase-like NADH-dependent reductase (Old Yellow Enzyme family)/thioredoxin reductase
MDLFSSLKIKGRIFFNRAVMAPLAMNFAGEDGSVTLSLKDFYVARARAGVGFIVLGGTYVHRDGQGFRRQMGIYSDDLMPGLTDLAHALRDHTRIGIQLSLKTIGRPPESFELNQIKTYRNAFARAAVRARECGFDAVELHACHDYWLNFFLSSHVNRRTDEYGGSLENRFRLLKETIQEIRTQAGDQLLLGVRLSLDEFVDDGLNLVQTLQVGRWLEELKIDYISASAGIGLTHYRISPPSDVKRGSELALARALKETVAIPVIGVGRLDRPREFKAAISEGHVDFVAAGRALIADPEFVAKMKQGRGDEIRPCLACNFCLTCLQRDEEVRCAVNPFVGRDSIELKRLSKKVKVLVVGGGPAGLTAATTAAKRGARVKLTERRHSLGGLLTVAQIPPFKDPIKDLVGYLAGEAARAGVEIQTGKETTPQTVLDENPDELILATGSVPLRPDIPRADSDFVVTAEDLLQQGDVRPGRYLIVGGGLVGLETAVYLTEQGLCVTLVEMLNTLGQGLSPIRLMLLTDRLIKAGSNIITEAKVLSIEKGMVQLEVPTGRITLGPFETVVLATGYESDQSLTKAIGRGTPLKVIGDARQPRTIYEAIREGFECGLELGKGKEGYRRR